MDSLSKILIALFLFSIYGMVVSFIRYKKKDSFSLFVLIFSLLILVACAIYYL
jgi:Mg2+ and Co2+ transporter CorA